MNDTVVDRPFTPPPRSSPSRKLTPDEVPRTFRPIAPFSDRKLSIEDVTSNDDFKAALSLFSISREKKRLCDSESHYDEHAHKQSKQTYKDNRFDTIEEANLYCDKIDAIGIYKSTDDMYGRRQICVTGRNRRCQMVICQMYDKDLNAEVSSPGTN
jgi:hypothetical protein